ncbi:MAG: AraC family transcriptional regulator [Pseudomonadota bacterium]
MPPPFDQLCQSIARHCGGGRQTTAIAGLSLFRSETPGAPVNALYRPTLCVVAQGRKQVLLGERIVEYNASKYLIVTVDVPVRGCILEASAARPLLSLTLDLDVGRLAGLLLTMPAARPAPRPVGAMTVSAMHEALADPLLRLLKLLDHPADAAVLAPLIEQEIYYRLLQGEQGALLRHVATAGSHLARIGLATSWIRAHYAEPVGIDALAALAHMSVTSFHRHFKAVTTMSPLQYRTHIRLQEARRLMLTDSKDAGAIGHEVGYDSPSQFNREYRRRFGRPPAADAAQLRLHRSGPV